jgi:hypothetical protein
MILLVGLVVGLACLFLQAAASMLGARYFSRAAQKPLGSRPSLAIFVQFSVLMVVLMVGNVLQILIWALLYWMNGAFPDLETATYFSGVTFTTLGYGDFTLPPRLRLVGVMQAANGVMMFGITTAAFVAAVQHTMAQRSQHSLLAIDEQRRARPVGKPT